MPEQSPALRKVQVTIEATVEIADPAALEQAAVDDIISMAFVDSGDTTAEQVRQAELDHIRGDSIAAIQWMAVSGIALEDMPGIEVTESSCGASVLDDDSDEPEEARPDFAALFPLCRCGKDTCQTCSGFQFTPRTAAVLWATAGPMADMTYDDVIEHGDDPVTSAAGDWMVLDRYPPITFGQDAVWRRQAARAFDDLTDDIAAGRRPEPRCVGEEMALHLALRDSPAAFADDWAGMTATLEALPEHPDDYDWDTCVETFFQDTDVLTLFNASLDGIEDPDSEPNRTAGMGDMRPHAWFQPFNNVEPRDGRRPFRR